MVNYLINLASRMGHWSYALFFLVAMLECAAFVGVVVPGETLVLVGGFLAAQRVLDLDALIFTVIAGAILGDSIGYEIGRHLGRAWLLRYGKWVGVRERHLDQAHQFFAAHGGKTVF